MISRNFYITDNFNYKQICDNCPFDCKYQQYCTRFNSLGKITQVGKIDEDDIFCKGYVYR